MRIAHISDLHLARAPGPGEWNAKRLLGYVNFRLNRSRRHKAHSAQAALELLLARRPDLVLFTGDATQLGLPAEFAAVAELLSPFARAGIPVLAVPGNHDVYGGATPPGLADFIRRIALGQSPGADGIFRFPGVEILPLNQVVPTPPFFSYGRVDLRELAAARTAWAQPPSGVIRLTAGHFPVVSAHAHGDRDGAGAGRFRSLRGAGELLRFLVECRVAGYFCGHTHRQAVMDIPGAGRQYVAPALSMRSSVYASGEEKPDCPGVYVCRPEGAFPVKEERCRA